MSVVACVGSRETPRDVLALAERIGAALARRGCVVRSGNAPGADQAFGRGVNAVDPAKLHLYLPWHAFERNAIQAANEVRVLDPDSEIGLGTDAYCRYMDVAAEVDGSRWAHSTYVGMRLLARDAWMVDGVGRVIGWINHAKRRGGGTGFTFRAARRFGVRHLDDLSDPATLARVREEFSS